MADHRKSQLVALTWRGKLRGSTKSTSAGGDASTNGESHDKAHSASNARLDDPEVRFEVSAVQV